jgi:hypothetical protein
VMSFMLVTPSFQHYDPSTPKAKATGGSVLPAPRSFPRGGCSGG